MVTDSTAHLVQMWCKCSWVDIHIVLQVAHSFKPLTPVVCFQSVHQPFWQGNRLGSHSTLPQGLCPRSMVLLLGWSLRGIVCRSRVAIAAGGMIEA